MTTNRWRWPGWLQTWVSLSVLVSLRPALADEGMWLYNHPPRQLLREKYQFDPSDAWLEHLQKASVRFGNGGSAEFVSEDGLVLSNQHVASRTLQRLSTPEHNLTRDGFYARTPAEELPCPGVELRVLMEIEDVTARVNAAVQTGMTDEAAFVARRATIAAIEKESLDRTGLRSDVVTLYQGAEYHLYRYKRYTDVRLVFAPEEQVAFFGGDADNFEYPRYDLDITFFRAYENGRPARPEHYLKWSRNGAGEGELVFVSGHPGRTDRLRTVAELAYLRDMEYPRALARLKRVEVLLASYSRRSQENARRARADLRGIENGRKRLDGALAGLLDPELMRRRQAAEDQLRKAVGSLPGSDPALAACSNAWDRIEQAQTDIAAHALQFDLLESGNAFNTPLFGYARQLLRAAEEKAKPNGDRLEEYRSSSLASLELHLFAEQPIYADLETLKLADSLTRVDSQLGKGNPRVKQILAGKSPRARAVELVNGSRLTSPAVRREIYEGGPSRLAQTADPMIDLARLVDDDARAARKEIEVQREVIRQAHASIGKARYALFGARLSPDATSSLRLSFGTVKGYEEDTHAVPFQTSLSGLYQRASEQAGQPFFELPQRWISRRKRLDLATPMNFVSTADIIGGNSGSPVVNRQGEFVGIIFDGNIQSLVQDFIYTEEQARAVSVHSAGIIEALRKVYRADRLVDELLKARGQ